VRASRSSTDEVLKKEYLVKKNIVHLIDDILWHMPFKNPTHANRVIMLIMFIIHIMTIILIIRIMVIMLIMFIIHIMNIILIIRVMVIIRIMVIMHIILIISLFQVRIDVGLADHVWQNKHAAIAQEVDGLGPQFRQALFDGWLKYIKATYAAQPEEAAT
jgi:hypothetical protein